MTREELFNEETKKLWLGGMMGLVTGDALGCPVQFLSREEVAQDPVTGMRGYGTYYQPPGTWTDDSSMTLATLISIREHGTICQEDIMIRFSKWIREGQYTPFGRAFDIGGGTMKAVFRYLENKDIGTCGGRTEYDNGNGSLMRILPVCLYCDLMREAGEMDEREAVRLVHQVAGLTHNHLRGQIACGLYYFMVRAVLHEEDGLNGRLQKGLDAGFAFYEQDERNLQELAHYQRLRDLSGFMALPVSAIRSSGYVVDSLEAVLWSLCRSSSFPETLLTAVNLGEDTDTVGAIAGGLAGLYYGYDAIPAEWLEAIVYRDWLESFCSPL